MSKAIGRCLERAKDHQRGQRSPKDRWTSDSMGMGGGRSVLGVETREGGERKAGYV